MENVIKIIDYLDIDEILFFKLWITSGSPLEMKNFTIDFFEELCQNNSVNESTYLTCCNILKNCTEIQCAVMWVALRSLQKSMTKDGKEKIFWDNLEIQMLQFYTRLLTDAEQKLRNGENPEEITDDLFYDLYNVCFKPCANDCPLR